MMISELAIYCNLLDLDYDISTDHNSTNPNRITIRFKPNTAIIVTRDGNYKYRVRVLDPIGTTPKVFKPIVSIDLVKVEITKLLKGTDDVK